MGVWAMQLLSVLVVVAAVSSVVPLVRHPPPNLDRATRRRVSRDLRRGLIPAAEPDRSAAVRVAASQAASWWTVLMLAGLATSQVLLPSTTDYFDPRFSYAIAALLVVAAGSVLRDVVTGRRALRRLGTPAASRGVRAAVPVADPPPDVSTGDRRR